MSDQDALPAAWRQVDAILHDLGHAVDARLAATILTHQPTDHAVAGLIAELRRLEAGLRDCLAFLEAPDA
jgi:hypothetical protein